MKKTYHIKSISFHERAIFKTITSATTQNKTLKQLLTIYPNMKESDLETLDKIITDKEFEELLEEHGIN